MKPGKRKFFDSLNSISISEHDLVILPSTRDYQAKIFELINAARKRIYITALYIQDDKAGAAVLEALYEAKQKNPQLEIKILVDFLRAQRGLVGQHKSIGNVRLYREMNEKYQYPIDILGVPVKSREFLGVLHLKGLIFDDTVLYSGASINDVYLHYGEQYRYDRYHLINSASLADTFVRFLDSNFINRVAVKSLTSTSLAPAKSLKKEIRKQKATLRNTDYLFEGNQKSEMYGRLKVSPLFGFGGLRNKLNNAILGLIEQTEKEVIIFTPYFNFPAKVYKAVRGLLKRGKKVTLVVGDKRANDFFITEGQPFDKIGVLPYIYESNLKRFIKNNQKYIDTQLLEVNLWRDNFNSFHMKGINSDQSNYLITGHNINPRAWRLDIENGILIQDPEKLLVDKFDRELSQVMENCTRINHFDEIDTPSSYPAEVRKLLNTVTRARLDRILNRFL